MDLLKSACHGGLRTGQVFRLPWEGQTIMELEDLIKMARTTTMTSEEKEAQRRSFAFGNTNIENERITRETIDEAADNLSKNGVVGRK